MYEQKRLDDPCQSIRAERSNCVNSQAAKQLLGLNRSEYKNFDTPRLGRSNPVIKFIRVDFPARLAQRDW